MDGTLVSKAVAALQKYHSTVRKVAKPKLIEEDPLISLVIALKKIPDRTIRPLRVPLPHSLYPPVETDLCLITKREKAEAKEFLKAKNVEGVSKVIPISKLKTNYKSFEAKRQLSTSYDIFLADKRIYQMLPRLLGKKFFEKKKFPLPVDLQKRDLAYEIQRARDSTYLHIGLGSCCYVPIGRVGFSPDHLAENILSAIQGASSKIPGGLRNIQAVHLKTVDSIALPIYNSLPPPPGLLPSSLDGRPPTKRVKIDTDTLASEDSDNLNSEPELEVEPPKRKRKLSPSELPLERSLTFSDEGSVEVEETQGRSKGRLSMPGSVKKRIGSKTRLSKVSVKKVRGSTVQSSKYEKAIRRRTLN